MWLVIDDGIPQASAQEPELTSKAAVLLCQSCPPSSLAVDLQGGAPTTDGMTPPVVATSACQAQLASNQYPNAL
jgi:hypothetical protein